MILVTGGGGYIGSHLVKKLKEDGEKVIVFDNFERGHKWAVKGVEVVEGDL
ncbi:MAG: NAD-dependent epimerase/dehydratase family protein, partial [Defluviitoga tunisiensis]